MLPDLPPPENGGKTRHYLSRMRCRSASGTVNGELLQVRDMVRVLGDLRLTDRMWEVGHGGVRMRCVHRYLKTWVCS